MADTSHEVTVKKFEIQSKFKITSLPTDDQEIRRILREHLLPMTLFGEGPSQRRERLYDFIVNQKVDKEIQSTKKQENEEDEEDEEDEKSSDEDENEEEGKEGEEKKKKKKELYFTKSEDPLLAHSRKFFADYSIPRALARNERQKRLFSAIYPTKESVDQKKYILNKKFEQSKQNSTEIPEFSENEKLITQDYDNRTKLFSTLKRVELLASHHISRRPIAAISTLKLGGDNMLDWIALTLSWTGELAFHRTLTGTELSSTKAHEERGSCLACAKETSINSSNIYCATGGADNLVKFWVIPKKNLFGEENSQDNQKTTKPKAINSYSFTAHKKRIAKVAFHPSEKYFASTSFDKTWCLYDVNQRKLILQQTGHSQPAYGLDFQCDGSLLATTDLGGIVRIWDLRTGRSMMTFSGHCQQVNACAFSPNGFQLASAADDDTVKLWDLRQKKSFATILAHKKLISFVKFEPVYGRFLVTGSYDKSLRFWSSNEGHLIHSLDDAHDGVIFDGEITSWEKGTVPTLEAQANKMGIDKNKAAPEEGAAAADQDDSVMIVDDSVMIIEDPMIEEEEKNEELWKLRNENFSLVSCSHDKTFKVFHSKGTSVSSICINFEN